MLTYETSQLLIVICTTLLAYFPSVTISGYFQAWVADKLGDSTPRSMGFLSFDPMVHTSMIGLFLFLLARINYSFGMVFGNRVPVNPQNLSGRYRDVKILCLYFSPFAIQLVLLIIGAAAAAAFQLYFITQCTYPGMSGAVIKMFIQSFVFLNLMLLIISAIFGLLDSAIFFALGDRSGYEHYTFWVYLVGMLVMIFFVAPFLGIQFMQFVDACEMRFMYMFKWACGV